MIAVSGEQPDEVIQPEVEDDRSSIQPGDKVVLFIDDDATLTPILLDLAHQQGLKGIIALSGEKGLVLARELMPKAIVLDIRLPDMRGWTALDRLKHDTATQHIPVHVLSMDEDRRRGLALGAASYSPKSGNRQDLSAVMATVRRSVDRGVGTVLLAGFEAEQLQQIEELMSGGHIRTLAVSTMDDALERMQNHSVECVALSCTSEDINCAELIRQMKQRDETRELPIVVFFDEKIDEALCQILEERAGNGYFKSVQTFDELLQRCLLVLHVNVSEMPEERRRVLTDARQDTSLLEGRKVLIVDDDVRNIFALTTVLERQKLHVLHAESGRAGLEILTRTPDIDVVLMDVMMPEMDGYETTRAIRKIDEFRNIPIITVTAKAMKGDREKCIEAGASDYITKPVNLDELISLLRVWLPQRRSWQRDQHARSDVAQAQQIG
jgi:CheY-like chemotaxis protein